MGHYRKDWGAEPAGEGRYSFRLWSPGRERLGLRLGDREIAMEKGAGGWFEVEAEAAPGGAYAFVVDDLAVPDPAARAQMGDVHGPSKLVRPGGYAWRSEWRGRPWSEAVIYELHLGTFSPEGTFEGARRRLDHLLHLGVTAVEIMPVAQFGGDRGWGYDGVLPYAPHPAYGAPDDFRRFVEAAQERGLMVLLDVVYNHFGPDGNYLSTYAPEFFDPDRQTPWGAAIDYGQKPVREFFIQNALTWLEEFRLDGLRLDAVDHLRDKSEPEILVEIAARVRAHGFGRPIHLTTEDNRNITALHEPEAGLYDGEWNDDFHHAVHCALTGEAEGYYADFAVDPVGDLAVSLRDGYIEQGQARASGSARGKPSGHMPQSAFVNFIQNHDQVGNRAKGERLNHLAGPREIGVASALHLLSPFVPLLFMGEEWLERAPFLFFAGHTGELAAATTKGRREEFTAFGSFGAAEVPDPCDPATMERSRLDWERRDADQVRHLELVRRLLALRAAHVVPLIAEHAVGEARVTRHSDRALGAEWRFGRQVLWIEANLGAVPEAETARREGERMFELGDLRTDAYALAAGVGA